MKTVEFLFQIIKDDFILAGANPEARLSVILPSLLNRLKEIPTGTNLQEYKVLVARQLLDQNTSLEQAQTTLQDLQLQPGDYTMLIQPSQAKVQLNIYTEHKQHQWPITQQEALIGRRDDDKNVFPEVDLTQALKNPVKVSRQLAIVREVEGKWTIELHSASSSGLFVDQAKLERGKSLELKDETVLSLGTDLQNPTLRLYVRLIS